MTCLLKPAVYVMNHLSYAQKLLLIGTAFSLPFAFVVILLIQEANRQITFNENECNGVEEVSVSLRLLQNLRSCRMYSSAMRAGSDCEKEFDNSVAQVNAIIPVIDSLNRKFSGDRGEEGLKQFKDSWESIKSVWGRLDKRKDDVERYTELCSDLRIWIRTEASYYLNLDPDLHCSWFVDMLVVHLPAIGKDVSRSFAFCSNYAMRSGKWISNSDYSRLSGLYVDALENVDELAKDFEYEFRRADQQMLKPRIAPLIDGVIQVSNVSLSQLKSVLDTRRVDAPVNEFVVSYRNTQEALSNLSEVLAPELNTLIVNRLDAWKHKRNLAILAAAAAVIILAYIFIGFSYSVEHSLGQLEGATERMIAGTTERFCLDSRDELGRIANSYNLINAALVETRALKEKVERARLQAEELKREAERQTANLAGEVLERRETERRLNIQDAITRTLARSTTLEGAAPRILASIGEFVHADVCIIWQIDHNIKSLRGAMVWTRSPQFGRLARETRDILLAKGAGVPGRVWSLGQPAWTSANPGENTDAHGALAAQAGLRGAYGFPIVHGSCMLGVVEVLCRDTLVPDEKFVRVMTDISSQLGQFMGREIAQRERKYLEVQLLQAQKLESIGQLAAGIAHEINTPTQYIGDNARFIKDSFSDLKTLLSAYGNFVSKAGDGKAAAADLEEIHAAQKSADIEFLSQEIPSAIEQTLEGVKRVTEIVGAMKEFSHPGKEEKTSIDINHAISNTLTVARNEWKYVADVETEFASDLPQVPCVPGAFNQVILNLVVNAAQAIGEGSGTGPKKGTITISTRRAGDCIEIRIKDTGKGIPKRIHARIFEPFFTTKEVGKGTGQGLAIARSVICDKHGGSIHFESEENKGTTFIVRLPLIDTTSSRLLESINAPGDAEQGSRSARRLYEEENSVRR